MGLKLGVQDVITQREFGTMEKRMPLYAWVIRHNAQARATALGRKAYIMGRAFAERLHKEALAEARAEVERQRAKASEARAQTREAKAQTRNAERREETARIKLKKAEFSAAEADFIARWRLAEERAISRMRIESVREQMKETIVTLRVREAQKRAVEREREETERHRRMRAEFSAAEADFIARWRLAEERAISRMRRTCNKSECIKGRKGPVKGCWRDPIVVRGQPL